MPKQVLAGQAMHGVPGFMALTYTLLPSSKTRLVACGSAEVVLEPERAKLLLTTAALATPYKRAKPKPGQKQGPRTKLIAVQCREQSPENRKQSS